ncbi:MAG: hypothetical protein KM296_05775 [Brockia lithotrophica]|nr:hypothetical protein [Brockia lithotrophica]
MAWSSASRPDRLLLTRQFPIGADRLPEFEPIVQAAKGRILEKLDRRIRHMEHAMTKALAELDRKEGIAVSVLGDLTGLSSETSSMFPDRCLSTRSGTGAGTNG